MKLDKIRISQLGQHLACEQCHRVESSIAEFERGDEIEDAGTKLAANSLCLCQHGGGTAEHDLTEFETVCELEVASHTIALSGVVGAIIAGAGDRRLESLVGENRTAALATGVARFEVGGGLLVAVGDVKSEAIQDVFGRRRPGGPVREGCSSANLVHWDCAP